jgi:hypothetical protein
MAAPMPISPGELGRIWGLAYEGRTARLCLANNTGGLTKASTTAQWDALELTGNGYSRVTWTLPAGSFSATADRFQPPQQLCSFTASALGAGLTYDTVYLVIGALSPGSWEPSIFGLFTETPNIALPPGAPRSYRVQLFTDDVIVTA